MSSAMKLFARADDKGLIFEAAMTRYGLDYKKV